MILINKLNVFNLGLLSRQRTFLMGVATIMIILCHIPKYGVNVDGLLRFILAYGNIGVDIFLFLSGLGCYYSLSKTKKLKAWYKKRFYRIFVPYTLIQLPFWLYYIIIGDFNFFHEILIYSTFGFWVWHHGAWYIALLIPLYALTPLIYRILYNGRYKLFKTIFIIIFILILCNISIESVHDKPFYEILKNIQWTFVRVPSFVIGMALASLVKQNIKINTLLILILSISSYLIIHQINANIFALWCIVPAILIVIATCFDYIKDSVVFKFISWLGILSLESYLANIYLCEVIKDVVNRIGYCSLFYGHYLEYLCIILLGIIIAILINKISALIINTKI